MASVLLQRIRKRTDEVLTEAQAGFRAGHSIIDQLFTLRFMIEEYIGYGKDLYVCSVDFQEAFDSIWRAGLWQDMRHLRYDEKIIRLLEDLYNDTMSALWVDGELTNWFKPLVGVSQGCFLSPMLFNILLKIVMALATTDVEFGALISGRRISNLQFADDIGLLAESEPDLQSLITSVDTVSSRFGLRVSSA